MLSARSDRSMRVAIKHRAFEPDIVAASAACNADPELGRLLPTGVESRRVQCSAAMSSDERFGGGIIPESGGAIISEQRGGFGIGRQTRRPARKSGLSWMLRPAKGICMHKEPNHIVVGSIALIILAAAVFVGLYYSSVWSR